MERQRIGSAPVVEGRQRHAAGEAPSDSRPPPNKHQCRDCDRLLERQDEYACIECKLWPLCGQCILRRHLSHPGCFNVFKLFQQRMAEYGEWWAVAGGAQDAVIRRVHNRIVSATSLCDKLSKTSPRYKEPEFRGHVTRAYRDVKEYTFPYRHALIVGAHFDWVDGLQRQYCEHCSLGDMAMTGEAVRRLILGGVGFLHFTKLLVTFHHLTVPIVLAPLETALVELDGLNSLMAAAMESGEASTSEGLKQRGAPLTVWKPRRGANLERSKSVPNSDLL